MVQDFCNRADVVRINFRMRFVDLDLYFVEDGFRSDEEVSSCRITSPYNSRSAIHLNAEMTIGEEPVQSSQVARQDRVFGVFDVLVLHVRSIAGPGVLWGVWWTVRELARDAGFAGVLVLIIRGQRKEGQGRPDDEKGRHWGSQLFSRAGYKERGTKLSP